MRTVSIVSVCITQFFCGFALQIPASGSQLLGPALLLQDSVVLEETASDFVGSPLSVVLGPNNSFLIPDAFANTVLHFDSDGKLVRTFGTQGRGPGEILRISDGVFATDAVLGILDVGAVQLQLYDLRDGEYIGSIGLVHGERLTSFSQVQDSLWLAGINTDGWKAVGVVSVDDLLSIARSDMSTSVPFLDRVAVPHPYTVNPIILGSMGRGLLDVGHTDLLVGFSGTPFLMRVAPGVPIDTLWLSPRIRRGIPVDLLDIMDPRHGGDPRRFVNDVSVMSVLSRDDDGNIFTVHQETTLVDRQVQDVTLYVASASSDGSRQCSDSVVPTSGVGSPRASLSGSQLFLLDQRIANQGTGSVTTVVRRFQIDPMDCSGK